MLRQRPTSSTTARPLALRHAVNKTLSATNRSRPTDQQYKLLVYRTHAFGSTAAAAAAAAGGDDLSDALTLTHACSQLAVGHHQPTPQL